MKKWGMVLMKKGEYRDSQKNESYSHLNCAYMEYLCMYDVIDDVLLLKLLIIFTIFGVFHHYN